MLKSVAFEDRDQFAAGAFAVRAGDACRAFGVAGAQTFDHLHVFLVELTGFGRSRSENMRARCARSQ